MDKVTIAKKLKNELKSINIHDNTINSFMEKVIEFYENYSYEFQDNHFENIETIISIVDNFHKKSKKEKKEYLDLFKRQINSYLTF